MISCWVSFQQKNKKRNIIKMEINEMGERETEDPG